MPAHPAPDEGLAALLLDHPSREDEPVVHWLDGSLTLGELLAAAHALARLLTDHGVAEREPVVCVVDDGVNALIAMFATWLAGGVYLPINARLADPELHHQLAEGNPVVVVMAEGQAERVPARWNRLIAAKGHGYQRADYGADWRWQTGDPWVGERSAPGAALVMRTSGTTGPSKAIVLQHQGVLEGIDTVITKLRTAQRTDTERPPMPNLIPASLALWAGIWNALFAVRLGAAVVLMDRFDTADYTELVQRFGIRSTVLAPAMMTMLSEDPRITDLKPLRFVRSITAPLTPEQARRFHERFGADVLNSYGQTELGGEVVGWTAADVREFGETKLGAVGRAHPGIVVRILDEIRRELPTGDVGEIWVQSPFATAEDAADRVADGFLRTGDLGRLDDEGFLWIEGRVSDMINRGGLKIVPQEVEEVLRRHPDVADVCVAGVPDPRLGEVPVAWIQPAFGAAPQRAALLEFARQSLAGYKVPVAVRIVDELPRNEIGKVLRRDLIAGFDDAADGGAGGVGVR